MASVFTSFDCFISMKMSEMPLFEYYCIINIVEEVGDGAFGFSHLAGKLMCDLCWAGMCKHIVKLFVMCIYFI